VPVAIVLAAAVILAGVIVVAMGRGGELSRERPELPASTDFLSWSDVAEYRPPGAVFGYHAVAVERAFMLIARTIAERDAEIESLRRRLAEVQSGPAQPAQFLPGQVQPGQVQPGQFPHGQAQSDWQVATRGRGMPYGSAAHQASISRLGEDE
jgi:hypothetical protein